MKIARLLVSLIGSAALLTGALTIALTPASASASVTTPRSGASPVYVQLGQCILRAQVPVNTYAHGWYAQGTVQCDQSSTVQIEVCMQQLVTGGWQTIQSSCYTKGPVTGGSPTVLTEDSYNVAFVSGRYYRTWDWGWANGVTNTYTSSSIQG